MVERYGINVRHKKLGVIIVKNKVKAKVLRKKKQCILCGATKHIVSHHRIPRRIGGSNLPNNKVSLCRDCEQKVHKELLDPVIDYLLIIIEELQKTEAPPIMRKIGFMRTNGGRKKK